MCFLLLRCFFLFPHCAPYRGIVWGVVFSLLPSPHVLLFSALHDALSSCPVCHIVCVVYVGQGTAQSRWYLWLVTNKGIHSFIRLLSTLVLYFCLAREISFLSSLLATWSSEGLPQLKASFFCCRWTLTSLDIQDLLLGTPWSFWWEWSYSHRKS